MRRLVTAELTQSWRRPRKAVGGDAPRIQAIIDANANASAGAGADTITIGLPGFRPPKKPRRPTGGDMNPQHNGVESAHQSIAPALPKQPGARQQGGSSDATRTLLSAENLALAAQVLRAQRDLVKSKAYRPTPIGGR